MASTIRSICVALLLSAVVSTTPIGNSSEALLLEERDNSASFSASAGPSWSQGGAPFLELDNGVLFFFQGDGNIVVHQKDTQTVYWASGSTGQTCDNGRCKLQFQTDGNLVAVDYGVNPPHPFWSSGTNSYSGHPTAASQLIFRNSAPYIQLLSSGGFTEWETSGVSNSLLVSNDQQAVVDATWGAYWTGATNAPFLAIGDVLFFAQGDGNLVVHQEGTDTVYWASGSTGQNCDTRCHLQFQNDGNLVYVNYATNPPTPFWSSGSTDGGTRLIFSRTAPYIQVVDQWGDNVWKTVGIDGFSKAPNNPPPFRNPGTAPPYPKPDPCEQHSCYECFGDCGTFPDPPFEQQPGDGGCTSEFRRDLARRAIIWAAPLLGTSYESILLRRFQTCA